MRQNRKKSVLASVSLKGLWKEVMVELHFLSTGEFTGGPEGRRLRNFRNRTQSMERIIDNRVQEVFRREKVQQLTKTG